MKKILFFIFCFFLLINVTEAQNLTVFIDMDEVLNKSKVGKDLIIKLEKIQKKTTADLKKEEENLKTKEKNILSKKNVIKKEEFENEITKLREEVNLYRKKRQKLLDDLTQKKLNYTSDLINKIDPILNDYAKQNNISLILNKKNVLLGKSDLDITKKIIDLVNSKIKNLKIN